MSQFYQQLATLTPEQRALFEKKLAQKGMKSPTLSTIPQRSVWQKQADQDINTPDTAPLSFAQQRLWFVQQLDPENTAYNVASVLKLKRCLDCACRGCRVVGAADRAANHENARTVVPC